MNHGYPDGLIISAIPGKVQCPYRSVIITKGHTFLAFVQVSQWDSEKQKNFPMSVVPSMILHLAKTPVSLPE